MSARACLCPFDVRVCQHVGEHNDYHDCHWLVIECKFVNFIKYEKKIKITYCLVFTLIF